MVCGAHIVLCGVFGPEVAVAQLDVVEVVEGGHAEYLLVEGPEAQPYPLPRGVGDDHRGRPFIFVTGCLHVPFAHVVDISIEQTGLGTETEVEIDRGGRSGEDGQPARLYEIGVEHLRTVGIQTVPLQVAGKVGTPDPAGREQMGGGQIQLLLPVVIVHRLDSAVRGHYVVHVIVGVLGLHL